jgi:hypothetical protein
MGRERDGSDVQESRKKARFFQRLAHWVEDGGFHDKDVRWVGLDYIFDQSRCLG